MRPIVLGAAVWFAFCTVLLIAATGDTEFLVISTATPLGTFKLYLGAFQVCSDGRNSGCQSIGTDCSGASGSGNSSCSTFQAFRAFLILGLLTLIAMTFTAFFAAFNQLAAYDYSTLILGGISNFFILVSWSTFASWSSDASSYRGPSFALEVTVWIFQIVGIVWFALATLIWSDSAGGQTNIGPK